jgi:hypothetical protein
MRCTGHAERVGKNRCTILVRTVEKNDILEDRHLQGRAKKQEVCGRGLGLSDLGQRHWRTLENSVA